MDDLFLDLETASLAELNEVGAWVYSKHPSTYVYCAVFGSGDPSNLELDTWTSPHFLPAHIARAIEEGATIWAHNVFFERCLWENVLVPRYRFPTVSPDQWGCTQALGLALNLPGKLEGLGAVFGCEVQKDMEGAALMKKMATAVEDTGSGYSYPLATRENLARLISYCEDDVVSMGQCFAAMPHLRHDEQALWLVDQGINHRGVYLDRDFARRCRELAEQRQAELNDEMFGLTSGELSSASAVPAAKTWLKDQDVTLPVARRSGGKSSETLATRAVQMLLDEEDLPDVARDVLERRQEAAKATSLAKLHRVARMVDPADGRLRGALQFCGAITGRWASHGLQLHNLPKVKLSSAELGLARTVIEHGDLEALAWCFDAPLQVLSQLLRSVVSAPPGKELIAGDYSAIEARVVAWLAEQDDVVELFKRQDEDPDDPERDVYRQVAWTLDSAERQLGKVCQLALGYGMGSVRFHSTAASWGVALEPLEARRLAMAWREQNDQIVSFWYALGEAARNAVQNPGEMFQVGRIYCKSTKSCLRIVLPSGRALRYWRPRLLRRVKKMQIINDAGEFETTEFEGIELVYYTQGRDKKSMVPESAYGGKLVENVTQATARELLGFAMRTLELVDPYEIVIHVHDSLATEVPEGEGDVDEFCELMKRAPTWADGLPIAVDGYRDKRFRG